MNRRGFFKFLGLAPVAVLAAHTDTVGGHHVIIQGNADVAMIDAKLKASNAQMLAGLQKNIGPMMAKWNQRHGD